ncbi:hypothetical protein N7520_003408 [Penicillium odoratum]|uniref:uncharacterized protein n=1 Tax=Penicillium odoratum TaxID=1167516 RepID=UPI002547C067|nr:uncharacterized protein N7520_003408 [Penicillium odoratum]KAJ5768849.1 hypothetical protein N7520_003408 [Penicillium odoratum]
MPKLSTENPNALLQTSTDLQKISNGLADGILAKREEERGRKRDLDNEDADRDTHSSKRARSLSSHSTNSVATISTTRSASASPDRRSNPREHARDRATSSVATQGRPTQERDIDPDLENGLKIGTSGDDVEKAAPKNVEGIETLETEITAAAHVWTRVKLQRKGDLLLPELAATGLDSGRTGIEVLQYMLTQQDPDRNPGLEQGHPENEV